jgi:cytochrome c oxidase subunit 2
MNSSKLSLSTVVIIAVVGVLLVAGGFLISSATPLLFPPQASAEAIQVDQIAHYLLLIGGSIFLLVQGALIYSVLRFRAKPGDATDGPHIHGNTTLEIAWTVAPAIIVAVLAIISWQVFNQLQTPKPNEVTVKVDGRRFNWAFSYNAPLSLLPESVDVTKLPQDIQTALQNNNNALTITSPELHTFVGQSVLLDMIPQDVEHALWIPAFRIKQDLIPGRETTIRFTAIEVPGATYPTEYPIRCAELCGAGHGLMTSKVVVHKDEADFISWLTPLMEDKLHPPADPVVAGQQILTSGVYPCPTCHIETNLGWQPASPVGPSLNGVGDRAAGVRSSATGLSAKDYIYQSVHEPQAYLVPGFGPLMPQLNIPQCQALAIVAYLCTQTESGTPACTVPEYAQQCAGAAAPAAEATSEATAEVTSAAGESTVEPTSEATSQAVSTPVSEATSEATTSP